MLTRAVTSRGRVIPCFEGLSLIKYQQHHDLVCSGEAARPRANLESVVGRGATVRAAMSKGTMNSFIWENSIELFLRSNYPRMRVGAVPGKYLFRVKCPQKFARIIFHHEDSSVPATTLAVRQAATFKWIGVKAGNARVRHEPAHGGLAPGNGDEVLAIRRLANEQREVGFLVHNPPRTLVLDLSHRVVGLFVVEQEQLVLLC